MAHRFTGHWLRSTDQVPGTPFLALVRSHWQQLGCEIRRPFTAGVLKLFLTRIPKSIFFVCADSLFSVSLSSFFYMKNWTQRYKIE